MTEKPNLDELVHFGVLGMHWGHRKTNTKTDSFRLEKGTEIHRSILKTSEQHKGHAFATFKIKDAKGYASRNKFFCGTAYDMTMRAKEVLISPSKRERVNTFVKLMLNDPDFVKSFITQKNMYAPIKSRNDEERYKKSIKNIEREYSMFSVALGGSEPLRQKYFSELRKKGYNMIIDDADASFISNSPILIFDRQKSLEVIKVSKVTKEYLKELTNKK